MEKMSFSDRMKKYEAAYDSMYPIRLPLILRLDGVHFHTQIKKWNSKKPFDERISDAMQFTAKILCESISGTQLAYTQSDEITILIRDDMTHETQPWYGKEINKILSVSAARASNAFNYYFHSLQAVGKYEESMQINEMAEFDCRGFIVPEQEILNAFLWRQRDFQSNSVQMLGRVYFSKKEMDGKSVNELKNMLLDKNVDWDDLPTYNKLGACVIKRDTIKEVPKRDEKGKVISGELETVNRPTWTIDREIPVFSEDKEYINQFTQVPEEVYD